MKFVKIAPVALGCLLLANGVGQPAYAQVYSDRVETPEVCKRQARNGAIGGALLGAIIGAAVADKERRGEGALVGGLIGALAGSQVPKLTKCGQQLIRDGSVAVATDGRPVRMVADNGQEFHLRRASMPYEDNGENCVDVGLTIGNPDGSVMQPDQPITACQAYSGGEYRPRTETLPFSG